MERTTKRALSPQPNHRQEILDRVAILTFCLAAAYAIATGTASEATAAMLFAAFKPLKATSYRRMR
jgi:hypothetical protein